MIKVFRLNKTPKVTCNYIISTESNYKINISLFSTAFHCSIVVDIEIFTVITNILVVTLKFKK